MKINMMNNANCQMQMTNHGKNILATAILGLLLVCIQTSRAGTDPYPAARPPAGIQPKRPANYVPYKYPDSHQDLLKNDGPTMQKLAAQEWTDLEKVNAKGPFKNTRESLAMHECPEWFKDAKIGMFIDWGPWSVGGYAQSNSAAASGACYPDWYEMNIHDARTYSESGHMTLRGYHDQTWGADIGGDDLINLLSDERFNSRSFVTLAKDCGFRYVVPFLKHHGGFCLWDSSFTRRDSMDWAFHRDFATELSKACKQQSLKFGAYVSVGEWDYPAILQDGQIGAFGFNAQLRNITNLNQCYFLSGKIPVTNYVRDYFIPATKELLDKTKPDLIWYDGAWTATSDFYGTRDINAYYYNTALRDKREVCINDRSGSDYRDGKVIGKTDFTTSEYGHGASSLDQPWEECRSFSRNFGYNWTEESDADAILSDKACIDLIVDIVGRGGNLLLIVSPTGTGEIPPRQLHALRNMGDWLKQYGAAIYGTRAYTLTTQPKWGRITHSKDGSMVYLLVTQWPEDGRIEVPAIPVKAIENVQLMHGAGNPGFTQPNNDGAFMVDLSACQPADPRVSVVAIKTQQASQ